MGKTFPFSSVALALFFGMGFGIATQNIFFQWYYGVDRSVILRVYEETCYNAWLERCLAGERYEARLKDLREERSCLIQEGYIDRHEVNHP